MTERAALSVKEAADRYGVSTSTVYDAINKGTLAAKRVGRSLRIDVAALAAWFDGLDDARESA